MAKTMPDRGCAMSAGAEIVQLHDLGAVFGQNRELSAEGAGSRVPGMEHVSAQHAARYFSVMTSGLPSAVTVAVTLEFSRELNFGGRCSLAGESASGVASPSGTGVPSGMSRRLTTTR